MPTCCTSRSASTSSARSPTRRLVLLLGPWLALLVAALPAPETSRAQAPSSSFQATDLLKIEEIREVQLSPSGRSVAYTVRRSGPAASGRASRTQRRLYVTSAAGRDRPRQLTRTAGPARQPDWHPDGNRLAFVRPVAGTPQIFVLSLSGGEPYQLTDHPHGATHPRWGPDGDRVLFAGAVPEPALQRRTGPPPPSDRPGRSPGDLVRSVPPDTLLVLRHETTLDPVDTLAIGPAGLRRPGDTTRALRTPGGPPPDTARARRLTADSLRGLSPDSLRAVLAQLRLRPDTVTVPAPPDTAAAPDGDLLRARRWLDQRTAREAQVFTRPAPQTEAGPTPIPSYRHYYVVDVPPTATTGHPPRPSPRPVTRGYRSYRGAQWLPGGSQIVVSAPPRSARHPDRVRARTLYVVDLAPYRIQRLLRIDGYALTDPRVTTDGTTLAFRATPLSRPTYGAAQVGLFELDGRSAPQLITSGFDRSVEAFRWSPDGWYLYLTAAAASGRPLYRFAPFARGDTATARRETSLSDDYSTSRDTFALDSTMVRTAPHDRVLSTERAVQAFDVTDSNAIYAALTPQTPSELYANTISFNNERRISAHNVDWTSDRRLASTEPVDAWNGSLAVPGRLTRPPGSGGAGRAPLVVVPRGGPAALDGADPVSLWAERQYLAGRGYAVLEVWPRGSSGYGAAYRRANVQDWGPGPAADVLTLTDSVATRSWIDASRPLLAGRAYGASLAVWLLGHTDRFRAAVAQGGVYDLSAFFGESVAETTLADQFGGPPWSTTPSDTLPRPRPRPLLAAGLGPPPDSARAPRAALRRSTPMTGVQRIRTPLLLLHGTEDQTASSTQSLRLYRRLKTLERPVEYVRYPGVRHQFGGASPTQRVDRLVRLHEFFRRYVSP